MMQRSLSIGPWHVLLLVLAAACSGDKGTGSTTQSPANKPASPFESQAGKGDDANKQPPAPMPEGPGSRPTEKPSDFPTFKIETTKAGTGPALEFGQKAKFHYVGTLPNGRVFDSSRDRGEPFETVLGNRVVKGWVLGLEGMKVGERRRLIVPPELAYGKVGQSNIPPDSTLVFDVELMEIVAPASQPSSAPAQK